MRLPRHIYAARDDNAPRIKVGISEEPAFRLKCLEETERTTVTLVGIIPNAGHMAERRIHAELEAWALGGEWFHVDALATLEDRFDPFLTDLIAKRRQR